MENTPSPDEAKLRSAADSRGNNAPPKLRRVALTLETSARTRNRYGPDFAAQVLWMRLDGLTVPRIASALGCGEDLVAGAVQDWQETVRARVARDGRAFAPASHNRRRWGSRSPVF